LTVSKMHF